MEVANHWPLMVAPVRGENAIHKESSPMFSFQNLHVSKIPDNQALSESDRVWEKGSFIDIYI